MKGKSIADTAIELELHLFMELDSPISAPIQPFSIKLRSTPSRESLFLFPM